ncbi:hypothetical protein ACGFR8_00020 [Streptomyces brevispora]|uniref:hypothetical protein n=1 Tax=Streptomyces brevispora TaxID=887462 RepID=UPI0037165597
MFKNKRVRAAVWCGAGLSLVAGGVGVGVAFAVPAGSVKAVAPYAQAAAVVNADGTVDRSKGIEAVTKTATGRYCVELEDKSLDVRKVVPTATLQLYAFDYDVQVVTKPDPQCGSDPHTLLVGTGKPGIWADVAFTLIVS